MVLMAAALAVLLLPVPWRYVMPDDPVALAWRLDGRLTVDGSTIDPPGRWSWLVAVGRPQLVGELLLARSRGTRASGRNLRAGPATRQPTLSEPAAAAVGLRHAGRDIPLGLLVEARVPLLDGYPEVAVIAAVDGVPLADRQAWEQASDGWEATAGLAAGAGVSGAPGAVTFELADGRTFTAPGPGLPYAVVRTLDLAPPALEAGISFRVAQVLPWDWFRGLAVGGSHGLMIALTTYAHTADVDLAQGRHIAGTGGIRGDGTVTPIASLPGKAAAAHRAGADVLLVPAGQAHQVAELALPGTTVVPVATLQEAIDWLAAPLT
jgi:hypothetical protein